MQAPHARVPTDRADDSDARTSPPRKPPVLTRRAQRLLWLTCLCVVVYGTLGPLGPRHAVWLRRPAVWHWVPPYVASRVDDLVTNGLMYVPVGLALRLLIRRRGQVGRADFWAAWAVSTGLSYGTELLQQFMPARASSLVDVCANSGGALLGAALAVTVQRWLRFGHAYLFRYLHERRAGWSVAAVLAVATVLVLTTMPWKLRAPRTPPATPAHTAVDPLGVLRFTAFGAVGFLLAARMRASHRRGPVAAAAASVCTALLAVASELAQMVLAGHVASSLQAAIAAAGGALGASVAAFLLAPATDQHPVPSGPQAAAVPTACDRDPSALALAPRAPRFLAVLFLAVSGALALLWLVALLRGAGWRDHPVVQWPPFHAHFRAPVASALADILEQLALYGSVTVVCLALAGPSGRAVAFLLVTGLMAFTQIMQAYREGSAADSAAPLLALAAWWTALRVWRALFPSPHFTAPGSSSTRNFCRSASVSVPRHGYR